MSSGLIEIQRRMLDAMMDKSAIEGALALVADFTTVQTVQLIAGNQEAHILESHMYGADPVFREKEAEYLEINPRFTAIPMMNEQRALRDHDFISKEQIDRSTAYQEFLNPAGVGNFAGIMLRDGADSNLGLALAHPDSPITDFQVERLEAVGSIVKPLLEMASRMKLAQADIALAASGAQPAAVVRRDSVILRANAAFDELLRAGVLRLDRQQRLDLRSETTNRDFRATISAPLITRENRFVVQCEGCESPFIGTLYPLPIEDLTLRRGDVFLLQLERPLQPLKLDVQTVAEIFGLTKAEVDVANFLFQGLDPNGIAKKRGTSLSTVRTIMKSVMAKTESHRQAELVSKLASFGRRNS